MAKSVSIIGSGPGGLAAAMILSSRGFKVDVYEKQDYIGGRTSSMTLKDDFTFDMGPTFLMMDFILRDIFEFSGADIDKYLELIDMDPMYRLILPSKREFFPSRNARKMEMQLEELSKGSYKSYLNFMDKEEEKLDHLLPCLQVPYDSNWNLLSKRFLSAIPYLDFNISVYDVLKRYFTDEEIALSFTFQAKYLGMSPWTCPGTFSMIPYVEHKYGIFHVKGGLNQITKSFAKAAEENGAKIHVSSGVKEVVVRDKKARGILLDSGKYIESDYVIINEDFAHAMNNTINSKDKTKYTRGKMESKKYSCSTFMLYLAVDKIYDEFPHHNIIFAEDYKKNLTEISDLMILSDHPSIYIQNASVTDNTLAPEGMSTIYILVPVPNNTSDIRWDEVKDGLREKVLDIVEREGGFKDIRKHILEEKMITPAEWESEKFIFKGATFNLAHSIDQMLVFRPHNRHEQFENCYIVGGGTHPGSGLPTILESAKISSTQILKHAGKNK